MQNKSVAALSALLLFLFGIAVGVLAHRYYASTVVSATTSDDWRKTYIAEMRSKLALTPNQVNHLQVILDQTKAKYHAVRDVSRPAMTEVRDEQIRRVRQLLTPKQVAIYDQLLAQREKTQKEQDDRDRAKEQKDVADHVARLHGEQP